LAKHCCGMNMHGKRHAEHVIGKACHVAVCATDNPPHTVVTSVVVDAFCMS